MEPLQASGDLRHQQRMGAALVLRGLIVLPWPAKPSEAASTLVGFCQPQRTPGNRLLPCYLRYTLHYFASLATPVAAAQSDKPGAARSRSQWWGAA